MRKIKNFKVNLRVKEILRALEKLVDAAEMPVRLEESVQECCRFYSKFLSPAVIYKTFSKEELPCVYDKDVPLQWSAGSIFFVSIGDSICEEYSRNKKAFDKYWEKIVSAIAVYALEQSRDFTQKLILKEALEENCGISKSIDILQDLYRIAADSISADKIGISAEPGKLSPQYSTCGLFYWIPLKRKGKHFRRWGPIFY